MAEIEKVITVVAEWVKKAENDLKNPKGDVHNIISSASQRVLIPVRNGLLRRQN